MKALSDKPKTMQVYLTTAPTHEEALKLARLFVLSKLAACAQVFPPMTSVYPWEGNIEQEAEHLIMIKGRRSDAEALFNLLRENHSYSVPQWVALDVESVSTSYLKWLLEATNRSQS